MGWEGGKGYFYLKSPVFHRPPLREQDHNSNFTASTHYKTCEQNNGCSR